MLLSVEEAQGMILKQIKPHGRVINLNLTAAYGHLLSRDVRADHDIPPFTNSAMDGYAVLSDDVVRATASHPVHLKVIGTIRAGHPAGQSIQHGQCYKVMTGAPLPPGADAVVPVESTQSLPDASSVAILEASPPGRYMRGRGEDMPKNAVVLTRGTPITAPVMGTLATVGVPSVAVADPPKVAILATGDELKDLDQPLDPGTIRNSNSYALYGAIKEAGGMPQLYPSAPDDPQAIRALFQEAAAECDLLVSSGGVSVGDFDFVKPVIESLGELSLWRVNLKPGKPLAFGEVLGVPVLGLPGNPVSSLVTFELFVRPAIRRLIGDSQWSRLHLSLPLLEDFETRESRRQYVRSRLVLKDGALCLWPHANQGSAVQSSWQDVAALMIVPENTGPYRKGDLLQTLMLSLDPIMQP